MTTPLHRMLLAFASCALLVANSCSHAPTPDDSTNWMLATAPQPCPEGPNDLAGIEGWAPGAGKAEKMGQSMAQSFGAFGGGQPATPSPSPSQKCVGMAPAVIARFDAVAVAVKNLPVDSYDIDAKAKLLGSPAGAFSFVRDDVRLDNYAGIVRGASGTLMSLSGNPDDKIVLLAALLTSQGVSVRYVHGALSDSEVASIDAASIAPAPVQQRTDSTPPPDAQAVQRLNDLQQQVETQLQTGIDDGRRATDSFVTMIAAAGKPLSADATPLLASMHTVLRDHWWIQAQEQGAWLDLDPTLSSSKPGNHLGTASTDEPTSAMPDERYATLTVRLAEDTLGADGLHTATLLEKTARSADVYAVPLRISINGQTPGLSHLAQNTTFVPTIAFGDDSQDGTAFAPDPSTGPRLARLRLEIVSAVPGHATSTAVRTVVDRLAPGGSQVDPAWTPQRTAYALSATYTGLAAGGSISNAFALTHEGKAIRALRALTAYVDSGSAAPDALPSDAADAYPIDVMRYLRIDAGIRSGIVRAGNRLIADRPQIAFEKFSVSPTAHNKLTANLVFDIVENGVLPIGPDAIRNNVTRGYIDTVIEGNLIDTSGPSGTLAIFGAARAAAVPTRVITSAPASASATIPAALSQSLQSAVAIAPARSVQVDGAQRFGWWSIDPLTGNTVGRVSSGEGAAMVEFVIDNTHISMKTLNVASALYGFLKCMLDASLGAVEGQSASAIQTADWRCIAATACTFIANLLLGMAFGGERDAAELWVLVGIQNFAIGKLGLGGTGGLCKWTAGHFFG